MLTVNYDLKKKKVAYFSTDDDEAWCITLHVEILFKASLQLAVIYACECL